MEPIRLYPTLQPASRRDTMATEEQLRSLEQRIAMHGWAPVRRFANGVGGICEPTQLHLLTSAEAGAVLLGLQVWAEATGAEAA